jgi:hypothetical protein
LKAGVNQQPPVHQFRMRSFKPFWEWTQNTSSSPPQEFFSPFLYPKIFPSPSYLSPPSPHLLFTSSVHSISKKHKKTTKKSQEKGRKLPLNSRLLSSPSFLVMLSCNLVVFESLWGSHHNKRRVSYKCSLGYETTLPFVHCLSWSKSYKCNHFLAC